jgi:hypothetical protein
MESDWWDNRQLWLSLSKAPMPEGGLGVSIRYESKKISPFGKETGLLCKGWWGDREILVKVTIINMESQQ